MGWYDNIKAYVWDDRTTPYLVPVPRLARPQADKELQVYTIFLTIVFAAGSIVALALAKSQHNPLFYLAALHGVSIVWCAIYLAFTKHAAAARYAVSAPLAGLAGFATGTLNPRLQPIETVLLVVFCVLWLWYALRVLAIVRAYPHLRPDLPPDLPPGPPSPRLRP
jgi:hypothetical protein